MSPRIFISIISYRDPLLMSTVMSAYNNARYKQQLVFGIVDQAYPGEFFTPKALSYDGQIRYLRVDPEYARGACWARNSAQTMWNGEDYFMQIDSHTLFDADWDEILINAYQDLKQYHDKPVITAYPHSFSAVDDNINNLKKYKYNGLLTLVVDAPGTFKKDLYVSTHARVRSVRQYSRTCSGSQRSCTRFLTERQLPIRARLRLRRSAVRSLPLLLRRGALACFETVDTRIQHLPHPADPGIPPLRTELPDDSVERHVHRKQPRTKVVQLR